MSTESHDETPSPSPLELAEGSVEMEEDVEFRSAEPMHGAHRRRWWLKVPAKCRDIALPPSSYMEQADGRVEMEGDGKFRRKPNNPMKAISGIGWIYQKGALERGKQRRVCVGFIRHIPDSTVDLFK